MITDFDDFCLWVYVVVDDLCQKLAAQRRRPGPQPACSDSELIAMSLIGECRRWDQETELLSYMQEHRDKFPIVPEQRSFQPAATPTDGGHQPDKAHDVGADRTCSGSALCAR